MEVVSIATTSLIQLIKKISKEERQASISADMMLATVTSVKPLKVKISSKVTLDSDFFYITDTLANKISDDKVKKGDKVVLIRSDGGQRFLVIDKAVI